MTSTSTTRVTRVVVAGVLVAIVGLFVVRQRRPEPQVLPTTSVVLVEAFGCKRTATRTVATAIARTEAGTPLFLTVAHGVAGQDLIEVVGNGGRFAADVVAINTEWDLAILAPRERDASALAEIQPVDRGTAVAGEARLIVFPNDGATGTMQQQRPARIVKRTRIRTEDIYLRDVAEDRLRPGLEVRVEVNVGDSGGPLFANDGSLVGIIWGTSRKTPGRSWATRIEAADELIAAAQVQLGDSRDTPLGLVACAP